MLFRFRSDIKLIKFEDLGIVMDDNKKSCYILNQTATWLLSMMSEFVSLEDLLTLAQEKYKINPKDNIFSEIKEIITYFSQINLIEIRCLGE